MKRTIRIDPALERARTGGERYLIVNADDFGQSPGVNRGIMRAHEQGIVTSASLMVRWPAAAEAAAHARAHPDLSVGLHVDLGEWTYRDDIWVPEYEVVTAYDGATIATEVSQQLTAFRDLVGRDPTHIDSHQHVHSAEPARSVLVEAAHRLGVALRNCTPGIRYCGAFYGQTAAGMSLEDSISVSALIRILRGLPPGVTELGCHPGEADNRNAAYGVERLRELETLCSPEVRAAIRAERIELCSFAGIRRTTGNPGLG